MGPLGPSMQLRHLLRFEQRLPLEAIGFLFHPEPESERSAAQAAGGRAVYEFAEGWRSRSAEPTLHQNRSETCFLILSNQPLPLFPPLDFCSISLICSNIGSKSAFLP